MAEHSGRSSKRGRWDGGPRQWCDCRRPTAGTAFAGRHVDDSPGAFDGLASTPMAFLVPLLIVEAIAVFALGINTPGFPTFAALIIVMAVTILAGLSWAARTAVRAPWRCTVNSRLIEPVSPWHGNSEGQWTSG